MFEGASSGLLSDDDVAEAGDALEPGTSAALLVYENTWAAPFASARAPLRRPAGRQRPHPRPSRPRRPRRGRGRRPRRRRTPCQDYSEASPAPPSSPAPRPRSATASHAARASAGRSRKQQQPPAAGAGRRPPRRPPGRRVDDRPAQGARRAEEPGHPHRGGVRRPEGQAARLRCRNGAGLTVPLREWCSQRGGPDREVTRGNVTRSRWCWPRSCWRCRLPDGLPAVSYGKVKLLFWVGPATWRTVPRAT